MSGVLATAGSEDGKGAAVRSQEASGGVTPTPAPAGKRTTACLKEPASHTEPVPRTVSN